MQSCVGSCATSTRPTTGKLAVGLVIKPGTSSCRFTRIQTEQDRRSVFTLRFIRLFARPQHVLSADSKKQEADYDSYIFHRSRDHRGSSSVAKASVSHTAVVEYYLCGRRSIALRLVCNVGHFSDFGDYQDWTKFDDATPGEIQGSVGRLATPDVFHSRCTLALHHHDVDVCRLFYKSYVRQDEVGLSL